MAVIFTLFRTLKALNALANRHAGKLLAVGLAAVALRNWRLWQQDKAFLAEKGQSEPLPPLASWPDLPKVSVLVAAWNEAGNIERHIESFLALRYPHKELVLCAGGPDGTYEIAARRANDQVVVLRQQPGEGKQRALARSFGQTQGEVIFLTDADCELSNEPFERTLWPVACGVEQVATGGSRPFDHQLSHPFIFTQAATQVYGALHGPEHAPGVLGRNCAVRRALLGSTAALDIPAPTGGTDYVLAKTLDAAGVRIRQTPDSLLPTEYPLTTQQYFRQQRRWLRNVVLYGRSFGATDEVRASMSTSLVGLSMLLLPLFGLLIAPWLLVAWSLLVAQGFFARLRYLFYAEKVLNRPIHLADVAWQGPLLMLDFVVWTQPLADYMRQRNRWMW